MSSSKFISYQIHENSNLKSTDNSYSYEYIYQYEDENGNIIEREGNLIAKVTLLLTPYSVNRFTIKKLFIFIQIIKLHHLKSAP